MSDNDPTVPLPDPGELLARALRTPGTTSDGRWTPPAPEELAALLPQYHIESLLGRGGMGAVYKGVQTALDRPVAIKLLPLEISTDRAFADRFVREVRTLAKLSHPNIVAIHDFGTTWEGHLYFVMEFVEGTDLHRMIHGPGLNPAQTLSITVGVCEALQYAHGKGVVHRDIKPANVMVSTEGVVKVADFGLARLNTPESEALGHTMTGTVMGTPAYMAPEQTRGMHVDHRADIYSLGVMLYEMLCGEVPRGVFEPPSHKVQVDVRVDEVVLKAMQSEPERRYQNTGEMITDVDAIQMQNAMKRSILRFIPALSTGIAACVAILGIIGWFAFGKKEPQLAEAGRDAKEGNPALQHEGAAATPSVSVAPGEWLKVNLSADLPIRGLETNGVVKDGRLTLQNADARLMVPEMRDGALRVRVRQGAKALRFSVRSHEGAGLTVVLDGVKLTVIAPNGSPYGGTYGNRPLNIPADGSEILIQFAHYGGSYVVCLGDTNVASGSIAITPPTGTPALHADAAEITGLEVMSLDGVPKDRWPAFALARERMFVPTVPSAASARPGAD